MQQQTRRALLSIGAATPAIALLAAVPFVASASEAGAAEMEFRTKVLAWRGATVTAKRWDKAHHSRPFAAYQRARAKWEEACQHIPHHTTVRQYQSMDGMRSLTTSDRIDLSVARSAVKKPFSEAVDYNDACRELVEAEDRREAARQRLSGDYGLDQMGEQLDALNAQQDAQWEAVNRLFNEAMACPAASLQVVAAKLRLIEEIDSDLSEYGGQIAADIRRLAGREA